MVFANAEGRARLTSIQGSSFRIPAQAKYAFKHLPWYYVEVECVAHAEKKITDAYYYRSF